MKKPLFKTLILFSALGFALMSTACRKCSKCHYEYTSTGGQTQKVDMEEICGNSQDVDAHVQSCKSLASTHNGKCVCSDI